jgi:hypothetical protein
MTATTLPFEARILPSAGLSWACLVLQPVSMSQYLYAAEGRWLRGSTRATASTVSCGWLLKAIADSGQSDGPN